MLLNTYKLHTNLGTLLHLVTSSYIYSFMTFHKIQNLLRIKVPDHLSSTPSGALVAAAPADLPRSARAEDLEQSDEYL